MYYDINVVALDRTTGKYVSGLRTDDNPAVARGYALALGVLPRKLAGRLIQHLPYDM